MASKRTRSVSRRLAEGNSPNMTDYLGPSKRQKRANEKISHVELEQAGSPRVTRSETVRRQASEPKPTATRQYTRRSPGNEENDDDESVNINFNTVVSASNEARRSRPRTVNGVRAAETHVAPDRTSSNGVSDIEPYEAHDNETGDHPDLPPVRKRLVWHLKPTRTRRASQRVAQQPQEKTVNDNSWRNLYELESSPEPSTCSPPKVASGGKADAEMATAPRSERQQQNKLNGRKTTAPMVAQNEATSGSDEDGVGEEVQIEIGEDSVFIEAPRPDEELATVDIIINSLGGVIGTLAHAAWTGSSKWNASFDMARGGIQDDTKKCRTALGRSLMKQAKDLKALFDKAAAAAMNKEEGKRDAAYDETIDYLRDHSVDIGRHLAGIDTLIGKICTEELTGSSNLAGKALKARRQLLRDISRRLIPMAVLVIQATCSLGPSEERRGKLHMQLSFFTLQFFLRTVGWARRLERALTRGLEQWPFDPEYRQDQGQLDKSQAKSRDAKKRSREALEKQLSALHYKAKEAERKMQDQAQEAARTELQQRLKQRQRIRERVLDTANKRDQEEEFRRKADRWDAFCRSTQALNCAQDPLKEKWDAAEKFRLQLQASHPPALHNFAQNVQRGERSSSHTLVNRQAQNDTKFIEDDPSASGFGDDHPVQFRTALAGSCSHTKSSGLGNERASQETSPLNKPWGLDWTLAEEKVLLRAIRYTKNYHVVPLAAELRRTEYDVARKAAAVKEAYRSLYCERRRPIPDWAL